MVAAGLIGLVAATSPAGVAAAGTAGAGEGAGSVTVTAGSGGAAGTSEPGGDGGGGVVDCITVSAPSWVAVALGPGGAGAGQWEELRCGAPQNNVGEPAEYIWVATGTGGPASSPATLAVEAEATLDLPTPRVATSPDGAAVVNLPTWLWVDGDLWRPFSATARAGAVSATATARPVSVTWTTGDGASTVCPGPGLAWSPTAPAAGACTHVYTRPSPGLTVTATVTWQVTWSASGAAGGGTLPPLETSGQRGLAVDEVESVGVG